MSEVASFAKESDLCAGFIAALPDGWTAYPETGGFDILLARADGLQIGVEAKLKLNAKVILQAAEDCRHYYVDRAGPDCRAVLVPEAHNAELAALAKLLCVTVVTHRPPTRGVIRSAIWPNLPEAKDSYWNNDWHELCPAKRIELPDWVPDVVAGASAPVALTDWKIRAIKIAVTLEKRGYVTRQDFAHHKISMSRWTQGAWIIKGGAGWVAGQYLPNFRAQHPVNYPQIEADFDKWKSPGAGLLEKQAALL